MRRKLIISVTMLVVILAPDFAYNLYPQEVPYGWLSSRFMTGTFDLSKQVLPPVYQEVRQWLTSKVQPGDIFRLFWLPLDPAVISNLGFLYPGTPIFFPRFDERNYTQTIFAYLNNAPNLGWNTGLGKLLAIANVKYVIVNLSANDGGGIWKQKGPPSLSAWGPSNDLTYYFTGDPMGYEQILESEQHLKLVMHAQHFLAFENLDFVPYFTAYRSAYLVLPTSTIDQRIPAFSVYNYSNNLVTNGGFENGLQPWSTNGNWFSSGDSHSGRYAIEANRTEDGWILASQDVAFPENRSYYLSGWMKVQNVKQSHLRLTFYNSSGTAILNTYPQSGVDGTRDWWHVSEAGISPRGTSFVRILLLAGWSLDSVNPGFTWFDDVSFFEGYYPRPSPIHFWAYDILLGSSIGNLLSEIPTFGDRSLVVSSETISPSTIDDQKIKQLGQISSGLVLMGDAAPNSTLGPWVSQFSRLVFVYEPEAVLQPENGRWEHLKAPSVGTPEGIEVEGKGQASQNFLVPRKSNYTFAIHAISAGKIFMRIDDNVVRLDPFSESPWWYQSEGLTLSSGQHRMTLITNGNTTVLEKIIMLSSLGGMFRLEDLAPGPAPSITFREITPTHYRLKVDEHSPTFVLFGETFDPSWDAFASSVKLEHLPVPFHMYWSNLYAIGVYGQIIVEVNFQSQQWRNTLVTLWGVGWLLSIAYVGIGYRGEIASFARKLKKGVKLSS